MKIIFAALCQQSILDRDLNTFSLINVIEEVGLPIAPPEGGPGESTDDRARLSPAHFEMVIWWVRSQEETPERGRGRISLILPDEQVVGTQEVDVDLTVFLRLRTRVHFPGLPDGGAGNYRFLVEYKSGDDDWEPKYEYPVRVTAGPPTLPEPA